MWSRFLPRARIGVRIVAAIVLAMSWVLLLTGAFVFWRVQFALDRQLDQDLQAYSDLIAKVVITGEAMPSDKPGEVSQVYATDGRLLVSSDVGLPRLLTPAQAGDASSIPQQLDLASMLLPAAHPYRVRYVTAQTTHGPVVIASAISRRKHDEALRELLGQLVIADVATIVAAGLVGWAAMRAALGPVERYRQAAAAAGGDPRRRLPVDTDHDDELTRLGTTFNALLAELEEGQRRERQFLADASHELRSPLAVMSAEIEWARFRPRSENDMAQVLASLADQTERLSGLANALLDLEEATSTDVRRSPVRVDVLVDSSLANLRAVAATSNRTLAVQASNLEVCVDQPWLTLAITNLVTNALKHGAGTISVYADLTPHEDALQIDVIDAGGGIPTDLGDKAFDRFARDDASRSVPGHGLGLALVAAIARRHGGSATLIAGGVRLCIPVSDVT